MYSAGSPDNRPLGSSAVYSCNTNYTLTGDTLTAAGGTMITRPRVCVSGGRWSGSAPTCQSEPCVTVCVCEYIRYVRNTMKMIWSINFWL